MILIFFNFVLIKAVIDKNRTNNIFQYWISKNFQYFMPEACLLTIIVAAIEAASIAATIIVRLLTKISN